MSQQTEDQGMNLPNPAEMAKTYAEVAQRASRLITQFMEKKAKDGVNAPSDELGVAKAILAEYIKYVKSEPLIEHIDANPFGVKTGLKAALAGSLTHLAQSIG